MFIAKLWPADKELVCLNYLTVVLGLVTSVTHCTTRMVTTSRMRDWRIVVK